MTRLTSPPILLLLLLTSVACSDTGDGTVDTDTFPAVDVDADGIDDSIDTCIDRDRDGYGEGTDCLGPDCNDYVSQFHPGAAETCDGLDEDCDGQIDEDFFVGTPCLSGESPCGTGVIECSGISDPATVCSTAFGGSGFTGSELVLGDSVSGTTVGFPDNCSEYSSTRLAWHGPDVVYAYVAGSDGTVTVNLTDLTVNLDLLLLESDCLGDSCTAYSANIRTSSEQIVFTVTAGDIYYLVIDAQEADTEGPFALSISGS